MFGSVKIKNRFLTVISLLCVALFVAAAFLLLRSSAPDTVVINGANVPLGVSDDGDISEFLCLCGYELIQTVSDREITVPTIWNDVYTEYQELQRAQGFDLAPCKGKPARELILDCGDDQVTLLICEDRIIAAHINGIDRTAKPLLQ